MRVHLPLKQFTVLFFILLIGLASGPRILGAAYHNIASVHLSRGLGQVVSARFPLIIDAEGLANLEIARKWALASTRVRGSDEPLACLMIKLGFLQMRWQEVEALRRTAGCTDASLEIRPTLGLALAAFDQFQVGNGPDGEQLLRKALVAGSTLLGPSLSHSRTETRTSNDAVRPELSLDRPRFTLDVPGHTTPSDWALVGYDLDEAEVREAVPTTIALFWLPLSPAAKPEEGWQQSGNVWRQEVSSINLVPDGGFEWISDGETAWSLPGPSAHIDMGDRNGEQSKVLTIEPNPEDSSTIVSSPVMPVLRRCALLAGAWLRSGSRAIPAMSVVWAGVIDRPERRAFNDVIEGVVVRGWTHASGFVEVPADAQGVSLYFSNWSKPTNEDSALVVDDAFLLPIPVPGRATCPVSTWLSD